MAGSSTLNALSADSAVSMDKSGGLTSSASCPKWSCIVKKGRRQGSVNAAANVRSSAVISRQKKKSGKVMSVVGTGAMGNQKSKWSRLSW